ncbi:hypothetical protein AMTRI_Chr13g119470 [Amborella trichopoda]
MREVEPLNYPSEKPFIAPTEIIRDEKEEAIVGCGPGSGKGTQCSKIVDTFGFSHLSVGELLRREMSSDTENGAMICDIIKEGKIFPFEVTVKLLHKHMEANENNKFLIDGFPRTDENHVAFEQFIGVEPVFVLYFACLEEEMVRRVLSCNEGRVDDNIETIKRRLKVFRELNLPVINHYTARGEVRKINAVGTIDEVFDNIRSHFVAYEICTKLTCVSTSVQYFIDHG